MKKIFHYVLIAVCASLIGFSCEVDSDHEPVSKDSGKPETVSEVKVIPTKGGAIIQYTLPENDNILYVKGIYHLVNDQRVEVKTSFYNNFVEVEGLGDTETHKMTLYTVSRGEVSSDPVEVEFTPLPPAFWDTRATAQLLPTLGGVNLTAINEARDDLAYLIMMRDTTTQEWRPLAESFYSAARVVSYSIRGFSSDSTYSFALVLRDRFENYSDTLYADITPYFEEKLSAASAKIVQLPGDAPPNDRIANQANKNGSLFDGQTNWPSGVYLTHSAYTPGDPHLLTIDMGINARVSRLKVWDYLEFEGSAQTVPYANGAMRRFEVYGSLSYNPNGELDSTWVKLGTFESIKPSGLPEWVYDADDLNAAKAGFDYEFGDTPEIRYIRFRCLENWATGTYIALAEVEMYGNDGNPDND